jgi:hypothetical protein
MSLPLSRNTNYTPSSQIKSADLNEMQDWLIDYYAKQRLAQVLSIGGANGIPAVPANWASQVGGNWVSTVGTPGKLFLQVPIPNGRRITAVTVYFKHATATAGLVTAVLNQHTVDGDLRFAQSNVASSAASTAIQAIPLTGITAGVIGASASDVYEIAFDGTATVDTRTVYGAKVTFDYP